VRTPVREASLKTLRSASQASSWPGSWVLLSVLVLHGHSHSTDRWAIVRAVYFLPLPRCSPSTPHTKEHSLPMKKYP
jgi:hypothetical protein